MERDFVGLDSEDAIIKNASVEGCKEPDGFKAFNNQQECPIQSAHLQLLHHDSEQAVPMMINSFLRPFFSGAPVNSQLLKGVHGASNSVIPRCSGSLAPARLTILYGGMVNVYDGISPEKAQAIMLFAGNRAFAATGNAPQPMAQPYSDVSSSMSVSSCPVDQLIGGPPANKHRVMGSFGQAMQAAIPQARKASLARFFEKRMERVLASAPYSISKNTKDSAADNNAVVIASE